MAQNKKNINVQNISSRVAAFSVSGPNATFIGFQPHDEAAARKGVRFMTLHAGSLVLDRAARLEQRRAIDMTAGTVVPKALLDAKDIVRATFTTGAGVEARRQAINVESRLGRKVLKVFREANQLI